MKLLKFYAEWCGPCKIITQQLQTQDLGDVELVEINIDENPEKVTEYGIRSIPVLILEDDNGKVLHRQNGVPQNYDFLNQLTTE